MQQPSQSSLPSVLVTGATGSTGVEVLRSLSNSGKFRVVAGVRDVNKASQLASIKNVTVAQLDSDKPNTVSAFTGVQAVYLLTAMQQPAFSTWLDAIKAAGVKHVVYHSAIGAGPAAPLAAGRDHFEHEEMLRNLGLQWTVIRPTFFHQNIEKFHLSTIQQHSMFAGSAADGRFSSVDLRDVADAALQLFVHPDKHSGKIYTLTGDVTTEPTIASYISDAVGRKVQYVSWTVDEQRKKLREFGVPEWLIEETVVLDTIKREGWAAELLPDLETILGKKGITVKDYIKSIQDVLTASK